MSWRRAMISFVAVAIGVYAVLVGALYVKQRQIIYLPHKHLPSPAEAGLLEFKQVSVKSEDGLNLTAWYHPAIENLPTFVFFQGNGGNIGDRGDKVRPYINAGFGFLLVAYRGYAKNPGNPSEQGLYMDGRAHLNFLIGEGVPPEQWVLYGESLGTGIAAQLAFEWAKDKPVGAVVLEAPFTTLGDAAAKHYPYVPARYLVKDRYETISKIGKIDAPLFIVHGELDGVIPIDHGRKLLDAATAPKEGYWVNGGGHNNLYDFGVAERIMRFVGNIFPPGETESKSKN